MWKKKVSQASRIQAGCNFGKRLELGQLTGTDDVPSRVKWDQFLILELTYQLQQLRRTICERHSNGVMHRVVAKGC